MYRIRPARSCSSLCVGDFMLSLAFKVTKQSKHIVVSSHMPALAITTRRRERISELSGSIHANAHVSQYQLLSANEPAVGYSRTTCGPITVHSQLPENPWYSALSAPSDPSPRHKTQRGKFMSTICENER